MIRLRLSLFQNSDGKIFHLAILAADSLSHAVQLELLTDLVLHFFLFRFCQMVI